MPSRLIFTFAVLTLAACQPQTFTATAPADLAETPPGAAPGTCWGKQVTPAVIETVTEQVEETPAVTDAAGHVLLPARYATETRQAIVSERRVTWIETPCPDIMTPTFIASVQRALAARGIYRGPVTGALDPRTRAAIRRHQAAHGLDSDILALETARALGLVAVPRPR
ncbi:MAG: peptidoglycan-binding protein [Roseovarius sp.]|nr:peptidoglycan-binding domain-containing protein [Roseovarius autotrophicus]MBE0452409.1 peptidoglycan-binding protein [Roseovarius sp.]